MHPSATQTSLKRSLIIGFMLQIVFIIGVVFSLIAIVNESNKVVETQRDIIKVKESSVSLMMIANEQLIQPSVRAYQQWQTVMKDLRRQINLNRIPEMQIHNQALLSQLNEIEMAMQRVHSEALPEKVLIAMRPAIASQIYNLLALSKQLLKTSETLHVQKQQTIFILIGLLALLIITMPLLMVFITMKQVLNPIEALSESTQVIAQKNFTTPVPSSSLLELQPLVESMNAMRLTLLNEMALKSDLIEEIEKTTLAQEKAQALLETLQTNQAKMIQMEKLSAVGSMVGGVAHELNNPLMGVHNYIEYSLSKISEPKSIEMLNRAQEELERVQHLVTNMLIFSRAKQGAKLNYFSVFDLVENVALLLTAEFKKYAITFTNATDQHLQIYSNSDVLKQVLVNLITNARDAVKKNPLAQISILSEMAQNNRVKLTVEDNGTGIQDKDMSRIFDPFYTTKPAGEGTGLGLSISRELLQQLASDLELESTSPTGTRFSFTLPLTANTH